MLLFGRILKQKTRNCLSFCRFAFFHQSTGGLGKESAGSIEQYVLENILHDSAFKFLRLRPSFDQINNLVEPKYDRPPPLTFLINCALNNETISLLNLNEVWSKLSDSLLECDLESLKLLLKDLSYLERENFFRYRITDFDKQRNLLRLRQDEILENFSADNLTDLGIVYYKMRTEREPLFKTVMEKMCQNFEKYEELTGLALMALLCRDMENSMAQKLEKFQIANPNDLILTVLMALTFFRTQQWFSRSESLDLVVRSVPTLFASGKELFGEETFDTLILSPFKCLRREFTFDSTPYAKFNFHTALLEQPLETYSHFIWVNLATTYRQCEAYHEDFLKALEKKVSLDLLIMRVKDISNVLHSMVYLGYEPDPEFIDKICELMCSHSRINEGLRYANWYAVLAHNIMSFNVVPMQLIKILFSENYLNSCRKFITRDRSVDFGPFQSLYFVDAAIRIFIPNYKGPRLPLEFLNKVDFLTGELRTVWNADHPTALTRSILELASTLKDTIKADKDCIQVGLPLPHYNFTCMFLRYKNGRFIKMPDVTKKDFIGTSDFYSLRVPYNETRLVILPAIYTHYLANEYKLQGKIVQMRSILEYLGYKFVLVDTANWKHASNRKEFLWRLLRPYFPDDVFNLEFFGSEHYPRRDFAAEYGVDGKSLRTQSSTKKQRKKCFRIIA